MSISETTEENYDEEAPPFIDKEAQKERIRRILEYQKSLYFSSSSSSSSVSSSSTSFSSSRKRSSLLKLMKGGSTCLRRLFDMEHTSLATHFEDYSASPIIKSIPLWGSDSDHEYDHDPWEPVKQFGPNGQTKTDSEGGFMDGELDFGIRKSKTSNRLLKRKKSFRRLPGFGLWRCRGFRFRLKLKRLRIMICGRKF